MPFDAAEYTERYETFVPGPEGARQLARILRHNLPIKWDYSYQYYNGKDEGNFHRIADKGCGTAGCAIGVAYHLGWIDRPHVLSLEKKIGEIPHDIFMYSPYYGDEIEMKDVTPTMVADAIDDWLASIGERRSTDV